MRLTTPELRAFAAKLPKPAPKELKPDPRTERVMAAIDAAADRLNAGDNDPAKFRPSARIKLGYFVIATSGTDDCQRRAEEFVRDSLRTATTATE